MALKDFGKAENDLGEWMPFGLEGAFELRIRRIPYEIAQRISKRYGRETFIVEGGLKRPTIERSLDEATSWLLDQAIWAWTDARGLEVEVADAEGAKVWSQLLRRDVVQGDLITVDAGMMSAEVKRRVLTQLRPWCSVAPDEPGEKVEKQDLATFVVLQSARLASFAAKRAEEREGNS